jgi:hypothetical protein
MKQVQVAKHLFCFAHTDGKCFACGSLYPLRRSVAAEPRRRSHHLSMASRMLSCHKWGHDRTAAARFAPSFPVRMKATMFC